METATKKGAVVQGTEAPKKVKTVQITIEVLKDLTSNQELLEMFLKTVEQNEDMKAPIAYQFAKAMLKQTSLTV